MAISIIINLNKNIIQIHNNKNVKFLGKDFVNIFLEACQSICQSKKNDLVFDVAIPNLECCLLFISFANFYLMISISKIELDKLSSPTSSV